MRVRVHVRGVGPMMQRARSQGWRTNSPMISKPVLKRARGPAATAVAKTRKTSGIHMQHAPGEV